MARNRDTGPAVVDRPAVAVRLWVCVAPSAGVRWIEDAETADQAAKQYRTRYGLHESRTVDVTPLES